MCIQAAGRKMYEQYKERERETSCYLIECLKTKNPEKLSMWFEWHVLESSNTKPLSGVSPKGRAPWYCRCWQSPGPVRAIEPNLGVLEGGSNTTQFCNNFRDKWWLQDLWLGWPHLWHPPQHEQGRIRGPHYQVSGWERSVRILPGLVSWLLWVEPLQYHNVSALLL